MMTTFRQLEPSTGNNSAKAVDAMCSISLSRGWTILSLCVILTFSFRCRNLALMSYHNYECGIAALLDCCGLGPVPLLALRIVARFGENNFSR